jgi:hypothetical protein
MRTQMTGALAAIASVGMLAVSVPSQAQPPMTKDQLVGNWQIVSFKATSGDQTSHPLGDHPGGYWGFNRSRFWVLLINSARQAPASPAFTDAEAVSLMKSHAAYSGKYDVDPAQTPDGIKVTVHVDTSSSQALTGTDRVFFMRVDGNKLSVKSASLLIPMSGRTLSGVLQLEFVKAD